ncbi:MAG: T9SS type A sorting domain-containing protein [Bacteroidia bacterium]
MKKNLLLFIILFILFYISASAQTTIYNTNFGTVANVNPVGWTFTGIDMNISTNTSSSGYPGASGNAYLGEGNSVAFINTFGNSQASSQTGTSVATLTVSTVGYPTITLGFGMRKSSAGYNSNATYTLEWSSNNINYFAIPYTEATASGWGLASGSGLTLPATAGNQAVLYFRWTFVRTGTASNFKIDDVSVTGSTVTVTQPPMINMDVISTTNYLDWGVSSSPLSPYSVSGVINDPTDPASNTGIDFIISDPQVSVNVLTVTATSAVTSVVSNANLILTGSGASRNLKITSTGVGFSALTISVNNGTTTSSYVINYGASAAAITPTATFWHTGASDASDAIAIDDNFYITSDDELDVLGVYSRSLSGLPLVTFNYTSLIPLPDPSNPETDMEAATRSPFNPNKIFWLGSMSTGGSSFNIKPNRDCLLSTNVTGTGASTSFSILGYYNSLRTKIINWGDANGYSFSASAAAGVDSKTINGFAAEGMVFGPDNTTLYIGLRAPLVPVASRTNAVIAPIANFETWFNNGSPSGNPVIGSPIELNLGGRGIRDIIKLPNSTYIIVAGNYAGNPITSAIYKWTGNATDNPLLVTTSANGILNMEGVMAVNVSSQLSMTKLQVVSDLGGDLLYAEGTSTKDFAELPIRKFRLDNLNGIDLCLITSSATPVVSVSGLSLTSTPGFSYQWFYNNTAITSATLQGYNASQNGNYYVVVTNSLGCAANSSQVNILNVGLENYSDNKNSIVVYPNPFIENTTLQLTLSVNAKVTIEAYSVLGQKINTINDSELSTGIYNFNFGAKKLGYSAGVYILKTTVNDKTFVKRIIEND